jgi:sugar/nucleoside kinase (ribokinase family)
MDEGEASIVGCEFDVCEMVITNGSNGSRIIGDGEIKIDAVKCVDVVDTTGCGDTYSTGYLYCRALGMDYEESGRFAAAMCTLKLEHNGPFDGTLDDIETLIAKYQKQIV